jgi:thiol-disulfide isomerase/thioredoxin
MQVYKIVFLYLLIFNIPIEIQAQNTKLTPKSFILTGIIKNLPSSGKIGLGSLLENPSLLQLDSQWVHFNKGLFQFSGIVTDSIPVFIQCEMDNGGGIATDIFFIDQGLMHIELDYLTMRAEIPNIIGGKSNLYFKDLFGPAFRRNKDEIDSITNIMQGLDDIYKGDTLRMEFSKVRGKMAKASRKFREEIFSISKNNTGSLLPLYVLFHNFDDKFDDFTNWIQKLSYNDYIGQSIIFSALNNKANNRNQIKDGAIFPEFVFHFLSEKNNSIGTNQLLSKKYILIEFWFAKCGACIRQFNTFKDIHNESSIFRDSLNFVMITIDNLNQAYEANKISKQYPESWMSLWDVDGKIANQLDIYAFPFNVLLNKNGEVVKSNVEPYELIEILKRQ